MTRGKLAMVTNNRHLFSSIEFNGEMYIDGGYGEDAINTLDEIEDAGEFREAIERFNGEHHKYDDRELVFDMSDWYDQMLDMSRDYIDNWFSDYVYLLNLSDEAITVKTIDGEIKVDPLTTAVFNFGRYTGITNDNYEKYIELKTDYSELDEADVLAILKTEKDCHGIYDDAEDVGQDAFENSGAPDWLSYYVDMEELGADTARDDDTLMELPSGKYARVE